MAANRVGRRGGSPGGSRCPRTPPGLQRRPERVTVKYNRRELQRRLDTERWIDGRLEELYRGREGDIPAELNIDELLELETDEERAQKLRGFIRELLAQLKGLQKQQVLQHPPPPGPPNM
ncbi:protein phosphatase 1 regulatory subunit 14A isoform X2 [Patagioenas fasciata]|uniref:protein phosphatase 1 regulatory subunit 14A isoform X2 n=1 Tax=Patagioenas fasciata TaxID=372321 RepID=UPI003A98EDA6